MSKWLIWIVLSAVTGSPVLSALLLLAAWWLLDRATFRFFPSPVRVLRRWRRASQLQRELHTNPHDRRARLELAELWVDRRRYREAVELLRPNLEAGDDDSNTLFMMGLACLGAGHAEQGELLFKEALAVDPRFRHGVIELERGRWRLRRGDVPGAREALERFCDIRKGTVEGRVLLAEALRRGGEAGKAALVREEAWREYVAAPRFQRNTERSWAWRAKPSRPLTYAAIGLLLAALVARFAAPALGEAARTYRAEQMYLEPMYLEEGAEQLPPD